MIFSKYTKRLIVAFIDFLILSISLYIALSLRNLELVNCEYFYSVFFPFLLIIILSIVIFYMYGLYDKMTVKIYKELTGRVLSSQILAAVIGSIIFYATPFFSIAPKTVLIIYVLISSLLIFFWRRYAKIIIKSKSNIKVLLIAEGLELKELEEELKNNKVINAKKVDSIDLKDHHSLDIYTKIKNKIEKDGYNTLAINIHHLHIKNDVSLFYELLLEKINIIDFADLYEEVFDRIPLQNIDASWFFSNLYNKENRFYEKTKRVVDLAVSIPVFLISLIFYPIVYLAIKIQDGGGIFYTAERIGKSNKVFKIYKFRSMTEMRNNNIDVTSKEEKSRVTRFGDFIRKTRIDELPQLINIIRGDLSLIGPRPEFPALVREYTNQIPFYSIRHTVVPGLSGFAQIYQDQKSVPKFGIATDATKIKLSYDIYYLKHRSIIMDLSLIIKTVKILLGKTGL